MTMQATTAEKQYKKLYNRRPLMKSKPSNHLLIITKLCMRAGDILDTIALFNQKSYAHGFQYSVVCGCVH